MTKIFAEGFKSSQHYSHISLLQWS